MAYFYKCLLLLKKSKLSAHQLEIIALVLVLTLAFGLRVFRLEQPSDYYFDEVYHAYTARGYLNGEAESYQFWADSSEPGTAYEWLHPPIAKFGMVLGMLMFGENSFGWRIGSVVAGVAVVLGVWALAKKLFKSKKTAIIAAFLAAIEGLSITMSRIAMNDIYLAAFILSALYFYVCLKEEVSLAAGEKIDLGKDDLKNHDYRIKKNMVLTAIFTGLAVASKWTGFFLFPLYAIDWLVSLYLFKRKTDASMSPRGLQVLFRNGLLTGVISLIIYLGSYLQFFILGNTFEEFLETIKQTWIYQTTLEATHPYQSVPTEWLLSTKPVYMNLTNVGGDWVSAIINVGNWAIFALGLVAMIFMIFLTLRKFNQKFFLLILSYMIFFVPWVLSPRIMFFYHYLPSSILLILPLAWMLSKISKSEYGKGIMLVLFWFLMWLIVIVFAMILPVNIGIPVQKSFFNDMYLPLVSD